MLCSLYLIVYIWRLGVISNVEKFMLCQGCLGVLVLRYQFYRISVSIFAIKLCFSPFFLRFGFCPRVRRGWVVVNLVRQKDADLREDLDREDYHTWSGEQWHNRQCQDENPGLCTLIKKNSLTAENFFIIWPNELPRYSDHANAPVSVGGPTGHNLITNYRELY